MSMHTCGYLSMCQVPHTDLLKGQGCIAKWGCFSDKTQKELLAEKQTTNPEASIQRLGSLTCVSKCAISFTHTRVTAEKWQKSLMNRYSQQSVYLDNCSLLFLLHPVCYWQHYDLAKKRTVCSIPAPLLVARADAVNKILLPLCNQHLWDDTWTGWTPMRFLSIM